MKYAELAALYMEFYGCEKSSAKNHIAEGIKKKYLKKLSNGDYEFIYEIDPFELQEGYVFDFYQKE